MSFPRIINFSSMAHAGVSWMWCSRHTLHTDLSLGCFAVWSQRVLQGASVRSNVSTPIVVHQFQILFAAKQHKTAYAIKTRGFACKYSESQFQYQMLVPGVDEHELFAILLSGLLHAELYVPSPSPENIWIDIQIFQPASVINIKSIIDQTVTLFRVILYLFIFSFCEANHQQFSPSVRFFCFTKPQPQPAVAWVMLFLYC